MSIFKSFKKKRPTATDILKAELDMTKAELETAYSHFENVVDPDLISSSIYHINSIQERYKYLMKLIKAVEAENKAKQNAELWHNLRKRGCCKDIVKAKNILATASFIVCL